MKELDTRKVFTQYRGCIQPYEPVGGRKYTITHSDTTAELFVFISEEYAEDQVSKMHDEVRLSLESVTKGYILQGYVIIDNREVKGDSELRNRIFYNEMPVALQALRQADRFLYERYPFLENAHVIIQFISSQPEYHKTYDFGCIGNYRVIQG